jgi:guanylate kinase
LPEKHGTVYNKVMEDSAQAAGLKQKIDQYKPSAATTELVKSTPILLLVGVSGAGKDSIKHRLLKTGQYHHIVSHTTRQPRENQGVMEQEGQDYHFIGLGEAEEMLNAGAFVEAKFYSGNIYGTSAAEIQRAQDEHKIAVTDIEVQGVAEYESIKPDVKAVFVLPPSHDVWQQRLSRRYEGKVNPADLQRRMQTAKNELQEALQKDYYYFVINDNLDTAVEIVDSIAHGSSPADDNTARALAQELLAKL